ncbi:PREDICTED: palmitoyltransferase ZDHHC2 isoform X3 [Cyprinodon variegatus]|uniref:palmitoyltransferase ZDHHC2 isoform X3 n=1 Tax=Cyprinodon variegatus TaxID=28743 RepID=UPI0007429BA3|nr:PREDICTED: palmitoyltransferase ZDHHC2 isoform X3 [Cyprinodon variegatus]
MAPSGPRSIKRGCQRALYWIPVLFIALIVAWSYYAYVLQLCIESIEDTGEKVVYLLAYHVIFFMFVWAYWQTIFTKPMNPLKEFELSHSDKELLEREDRGESQQEILRRIAKDLPIYTRTNSGAIRFCDRCQLLKPDRCHHCSVCDKCILKMDHHCPWKGLPDTQAKFHILFLFFSASMFSVSLASLFIYHCWLVCKNRSTLEAVRAPVFRHGPDKNGFSLGFTKNFLQVFGDEAKYWPVPIFSSLGDGCSFPTCLVNLDPEQPSSPAGSSSANKSAAEGRQFPSKPLRESQSRLLTSTPSWSESEGARDKDKKGKIITQ